MTDEETMVLKAIEAHGRPLAKGETLIYFMQAEDGGPIKIGRALDPIKRKGEIQCGNPHPLKITRVIAANVADEWRLHQMFAEVRMSGEWFKPHPTLAAVADAKADASLSDVAVCQVGGGMLSDDRFEPPTPRPRWLVLDGHEDTITFRPNPDDAGWRKSSAA